LILAGALPQTPLGSSRRSPRPLAGFKGVLLLKEEGRGKRIKGKGNEEVSRRRKGTKGTKGEREGRRAPH